eukprot:Rhum_TRINITY_DN14989_c1_g1::Rhum_TRINITY_DN14989_c1_g1_i1::g.130787::m.130787
MINVQSLVFLRRLTKVSNAVVVHRVEQQQARRPNVAVRTRRSRHAARLKAQPVQRRPRRAVARSNVRLAVGRIGTVSRGTHNPRGDVVTGRVDACARIVQVDVRRLRLHAVQPALRRPDVEHQQRGVRRRCHRPHDLVQVQVRHRPRRVHVQQRSTHVPLHHLGDEHTGLQILPHAPDGCPGRLRQQPLLRVLDHVARRDVRHHPRHDPHNQQPRPHAQHEHGRQPDPAHASQNERGQCCHGRHRERRRQRGDEFRLEVSGERLPAGQPTGVGLSSGGGGEGQGQKRHKHRGQTAHGGHKKCANNEVQIL